MDWNAFFGDLSSFIVNAGTRVSHGDTSMAEYILQRIINYLHVLHGIKYKLEQGSGGDQDLMDILNTVSSLMKDVEEIYSHWVHIEAGIGESISSYKAPRVKNSIGKGRPSVMIEKEKIEFLRELRFSWTKIAELFGVCRRTLYTIRSEYDMVGSDSVFTQISDQELCEQARAIKQDMPEIGYNMMRGVLRSRGIHVSIPRIQQCVSTIDPINTALRWAAPTSRRSYNVPYPNFIWHLDGNHKLIR